MDSLRSDLRYALRMLARSPGFTALAVGSLALGIGVNTTIFSIVHAVVLAPLPYPEPERLAMVWLYNPRQGIDKDITSFPNYIDWRGRSRSFEQLAGYAGTSFSLTDGGEPEQLRGALVTPSFFRVLDVAGARGRVLEELDANAGSERVVVVGHALWRRRFGGDERIAGRTVKLSGSVYTIVGVTPPGFRYPAEADLWVPIVPVGPMQERLAARGSLWLGVIGRLRRGATFEAAQAEMDTIAADLAREHPGNAEMGIRLEGLRDTIVGDVRPALVALTGAVGLVLLICCANAASLLVARGLGRRKEIAIRHALGAGRLRLVRQLLTESVVLAVAAAVVGVVGAYWGVRVLVAIAPGDIPRLDEVRIDAWVLGLTAALSVATGLIFGLAPALAATRGSLEPDLKEGGRESSAGRVGGRLRGSLVAGEIALALAVGAGLLVRSFVGLVERKGAFQPDRVLTFRLALPRVSYPEPAKVDRATPRAADGRT